MVQAQIPEQIRRLALERSIGKVVRTDIPRAQAAMTILGIPSESEFYVFYSEFLPGNLRSTSSHESLVDVSEPSEQVAAGTRFAHEVWCLPDEYICFTTCEGEGGYLYSTRTHTVSDFSLAERDQFLAHHEPRWKNFYEFIAWYLSPAQAHEP